MNYSVEGDAAGKRPSHAAVRDRLESHPGYIEHLKIQAFITTLKSVFEPNYTMLIHVLDQTATDVDTAWEMVQNVRSPHIRNSIIGVVNCSLHNYVASSMTLVEHSRKLMNGRSGSIAAEFATKRLNIRKNPEVKFVQDLRNMAVHRSLPPLCHTVSFTQAVPGMQSEVEVTVKDLLSYKKWSSESVEFIRKHGERVQLRPIIRRHYSLVYTLNAWLIGKLQEANSDLLAEANEIVVEMNAAIAGIDLEAARRMTDEHSEGLTD